MPPVTSALIGANILGFLLQAAFPNLLLSFALWPFASSAFDAGGPGFAPWQVVTYSFLHGGLFHLAFNMFALYMFGSPVEQVFGARRYLTYYGVCVVSAAIAQLIVSSLSGDVYPTVGASGGVFGLLLAFAILFPHQRVMLIFPPIPMPSRVFVTIYAAIELYLGVTGTAEGVAHFAHLGGMVGGFLLLRHWRGPKRRG